MSAAVDLRIYALLPFRGLVNAKSRLASALSEAERRQLALALLNRAVAAVADAGVERIAVVTRDPLLAASGLDPRAEVLLQDNEGLNAAVRQGQRWALSGGAGGTTRGIGRARTRVGAELRRPVQGCLLYTSPSPRDRTRSRLPSSA